MGTRRVVFVGVNPSTADAQVDDNTVSRWIDYTKRWAFDEFVVGNVFAYRSTDVKVLRTVPDPVGPENDRHLREIIASAELVVPCWGRLNKLNKPLQCRLSQVREILREHPGEIRVFGLTKCLQPIHPLMQRGDVELQRWTP